MEVFLASIDSSCPALAVFKSGIPVVGVASGAFVTVMEVLVGATCWVLGPAAKTDDVMPKAMRVMAKGVRNLYVFFIRAPYLTAIVTLSPKAPLIAVCVVLERADTTA